MTTTFLNDITVDRFQNMHHTNSAVKSEFITFTALGVNLDSSTDTISFLQQKLDGKPIRAYFTTKMGQWLMAERTSFSKYRNEEILSKLLNAQLPFIFEVVISIQYLHNQILDGKAGVVTPERIAENLLSANLLKEQLYRYINQELPEWARQKVEKSIRRCFEYVDIGQLLELKANRYNSFIEKNITPQDILPTSVLNDIKLDSIATFINKIKADLPVFLHQQLEVYFHRIYLTCAALFVEITTLIGELLQLPAKKLNPHLQFSATYGLMRQLVNDNADWLPSQLGLSTHDKAPNDGFSDLRNGTLTLPLIFFIAEHKKSFLHDILSKNKNWSVTFENHAFETILESQALYQSIQNTRILGELALAYLPHSELGHYLANSCEIVHWNKFLVPCLKHSAYKKYRQTAYSKKTRHLIKTLRKQRLKDQKKPIKTTLLLPKITSSFPLAVSHLQQLLKTEVSRLNYFSD